MNMKNLEDYVVDQHGTVKILDGWRIMELDEMAIWPQDDVWVDKYSDENCGRFGKWMKEKGVCYYAAPKEDFFFFKAIEKAENEGCEYLILENLS